MPENSSKAIQESYWGIVLPAKKEMEEILSEHSEIRPKAEQTAAAIAVAVIHLTAEYCQAPHESLLLSYL